MDWGGECDRGGVMDWEAEREGGGVLDWEAESEGGGDPVRSSFDATTLGPRRPGFLAPSCTRAEGACGPTMAHHLSRLTRGFGQQHDDSWNTTARREFGDAAVDPDRRRRRG